MVVSMYDLRQRKNRIPYLKEIHKANVSIESCISPDRIATLFCEAFEADQLCEEHVWAVGLDNQCVPVGVFEITHGCENGSCLTTRAIMQRILLCGANRLALCHNHPTGYLNPSQEDLSITQKINDACKLMSIQLDDHIIVGHYGRYFSFHESGLIK